MTSIASQREALRQTMRRQRARLSIAQQHQAAQSLTRHLKSHLPFRRAQHIGTYLAQNGELDTLPALAQHQHRQQVLYLPAITLKPEPAIHMRKWLPGERMLTNIFAIDEPPPHPGHRSRPAWALDILLIPLVAFDDAGNRLGMGGGFYDRLLSEFTGRPTRPLLIGIGYQFQRVEKVPAEPWDMPLDRVITD